MTDVVFRSVLAPLLNGFLKEKRAMGYLYDTEEGILRRFDRWWIDHNQERKDLSAAALEGWCLQCANEGKRMFLKRIVAVRQFLRYAEGLGEVVWIPNIRIHAPRPAARVLSSSEIKEFFQIVDARLPRNPRPLYKAMAKEYPVILRLILSTGLRNGEAVSLRRTDVDTEKRTLTILGGKARKDRLVYMAPDVADMLDAHIGQLQDFSQFRHSEWLFPGGQPNGHITSENLCVKFRDFWDEMAQPDGGCKRPTVHSLRHTYVVNCINFWVKEGADLQVMIPYLSRQLGHGSPSATFYYYHQVYEGIGLLRQKDSLPDRVIPEVKPR